MFIALFFFIMFLFSNFYLSSFVLGLRCWTHFLEFILVIPNIIQLILLRRHKDEYYNAFCPWRDSDPIEAMNCMIKALKKSMRREAYSWKLRFHDLIAESFCHYLFLESCKVFICNFVAKNVLWYQMIYHVMFWDFLVWKGGRHRLHSLSSFGCISMVLLSLYKKGLTVVFGYTCI